MKALFTILVAVTVGTNLYAQNLTGKVLFSHHCQPCGGGVDSIYSMDNNGQNVMFVTTGFWPRLSHDGRYLAFSRGTTANSGFGANMWLRDLQLQHDTLILTNSDYLDYYDFSPSNTQIIFSQGCGVYTVGIDGSNAYAGAACTGCGCYSDDPTIRLSDSMVVYHNVYNGIYLSTFAVGSPDVIPHTYPGDQWPIWSPDGQWISYIKTSAWYTGNNLFKIKPDGSDSTQLSYLPVTDTLVADPTWASDMQAIYTIGRIGGVPGLYRFKTDGSGDHVMIKQLFDSGPIYTYWLGLADSISSFPLINASLDKPAASLTIDQTVAQLEVNATFTTPTNLQAEASVINALGQVVEYRFENASAGTNRWTFATKALPAGMYFLNVRSADATITRRFIVP